MVQSDKYLQQLRLGKESGLLHFMSKYNKALRFFAFSILRDKEVAEEIVADSFYKLWNGRDRIKTDESIKAFLYIATRNACYNHIGSSAKNIQYDLDALDSIPDRGTDILSNIIYVELVEQVIFEISKLPEQQARVFRMSFLEGLSTEEICEQLQTTASTVYFARSKALNTLKKVFELKGDIRLFQMFLSIIIFREIPFN